jgi:hydrogenase maturation protein HypF
MERRAIVVRGIVQGVGFRPFVFGLATRLRLRGFVQNRTGSVVIEVEGAPTALDSFLRELSTHPPPLAHIEHLSWERQAPRGEAGPFRIDASEADAASAIFISPDVAACSECLREMLDPGDRRWGYPFLNCTRCGPRLTVITGAPYDRQRTTLAGFPLCPECRQEYDDPANRRFHAQPTACPKCGPRLALLDGSGQTVSGAEPLAFFADAVLAGKIGAMKGLGGYHLVCDARSASAVVTLRKRKHRDEKPFAVMAADVPAAEALAEFDASERELLLSPRAPIVLVRKCDPCPVAHEVAPGNPWLGVMLPYTPLHHLLLRAVGGIPLVMTSGNRSDEPIAYEDDAPSKLAGIADLFLTHDRPIHVRCDDSVTRVIDGDELPVRRSRGYAPKPIRLPFPCPRPTLAVGGQLKATFALGRAEQAFLSHHLGDLDHYEAYRRFEKDVVLYQQLFAVEPERLVHDMHPDYATTRYAQERAAREGTLLLAVQHHHAHLASCMAENGLNEPVIGVTFDGTGYGADGAVWGGEFLVGDYGGFRRGAHLRYVAMPGGDAAIREPWRMAASHLEEAGVDFAPLKARILPEETRILRKMLEGRFNTPLTSSAGRLFDAVAVLCGVRDRVSYEGQAAVELEWLASGVTPGGAYPFDPGSPQATQTEWPRVVDTRPLIRAVAQDATKGVAAAVIARRFHSSMVDLIAAVCSSLRRATGLEKVVLSGGVFLNALISREVSVRLAGDGFRVYRHRLVPPNDGGLSLGQLAVACCQKSEVRSQRSESSKGESMNPGWVTDF